MQGNTPSGAGDSPKVHGYFSPTAWALRLLLAALAAGALNSCANFTATKKAGHLAIEGKHDYTSSILGEDVRLRVEGGHLTADMPLDDMHSILASVNSEKKITIVIASRLKPGGPLKCDATFRALGLDVSVESPSGARLLRCGILPPLHEISIYNLDDTVRTVAIAHYLQSLQIFHEVLQAFACETAGEDGINTEWASEVVNNALNETVLRLQNEKRIEDELRTMFKKASLGADGGNLIRCQVLENKGEIGFRLVFPDNAIALLVAGRNDTIYINYTAASLKYEILGRRGSILYYKSGADGGLFDSLSSSLKKQVEREYYGLISIASAGIKTFILSKNGAVSRACSNADRTLDRVMKEMQNPGINNQRQTEAWKLDLVQRRAPHNMPPVRSCYLRQKRFA